MRFVPVLLRSMLLPLLFCGLPGELWAQGTAVPTSVGEELQLLAKSAGTIFVGQITSINRKPGYVDVTFQVEQPLRGGVGQAFTLREWAGLWPPGHSRYTPGQRVLAFLRETSGVGFSSPVHGQEGLVPVVVQGSDAPQLLDVRRIAASIVRAPGTPLPTEANGAIQLQDAIQLVEGAPENEPARMRLPERGAPPSTPLERVLANSGSFTSRGWQRAPLSAPVLRRSSNVRP